MRQAHLVIGLGYGDEGKGSWVDYLVRRDGVKHVVRFNGGAQAAHNVVEPRGRHHTFAQFGSGAFVPGVMTLLSRFMLIEPEALLAEVQRLEAKGVESPKARLFVSENAPIITPYNRLLNRIQEVARGADRHGSCGFGIGITQGDVEILQDRALYVRDLKSSTLRDKLRALHDIRVNEALRFQSDATESLIETLKNVDLTFYETLFRGFAESITVLSEDEFYRVIRENDCVFEGAQGVLLDQHAGFFPHCTRSNTTFENALKLLDEASFDGEIIRTGLLRAYMTRHGAGPFVTEDPALKIAPCHNKTNPWQGSFRHGWFDAVAARYALEVVDGVDVLAITNLDRMDGLDQVKVATGYQNADTRFFDEDRIRKIEPDYTTLAERTRTMESIIPRYEEFPGWSEDTNGWLRYIETLERVLDRPVNAYSRSITHRKVIR